MKCLSGNLVAPGLEPLRELAARHWPWCWSVETWVAMLDTRDLHRIFILGPREPLAAIPTRTFRPGEQLALRF